MSITATNLNAAKFFVGADLTRLRGAADDFFKITKASDVGGGIGGIKGMSRCSPGRRTCTWAN